MRGAVVCMQAAMGDWSRLLHRRLYGLGGKGRGCGVAERHAVPAVHAVEVQHNVTPRAAKVQQRCVFGCAAASGLGAGCALCSALAPVCCWPAGRHGWLPNGMGGP